MAAVTAYTWEAAYDVVQARLAPTQPPTPRQVLCWPTGARRGGQTVTRIEDFTNDLFRQLAELSDMGSVDLDPEISDIHPAVAAW